MVKQIHRLRRLKVKVHIKKIVRSMERVQTAGLIGVHYCFLIKVLSMSLHRIKNESNVSIARLLNRPKWVMSKMSTMFQMTQHFPKLD